MREKVGFYFFCFVLYSGLGWIYEVTLALLYGWGFVNRGFLFGPYLPVYGVGGLLLILLLEPAVRKKPGVFGRPWAPLLVFLLVIFIATVLEYVTGAALWSLFHKRWWDYSDDFMNLNGFICPRTSFRFGLGGMFFLYVCQPFFRWLYGKIPERARKALIILLALVLLTDLAATLIALLM